MAGYQRFSPFRRFVRFVYLTVGMFLAVSVLPVQASAIPTPAASASQPVQLATSSDLTVPFSAPTSPVSAIDSSGFVPISDVVLGQAAPTNPDIARCQGLTDDQRRADQKCVDIANAAKAQAQQGAQPQAGAPAPDSVSGGGSAGAENGAKTGAILGSFLGPLGTVAGAGAGSALGATDTSNLTPIGPDESCWTTVDVFSSKFWNSCVAGVGDRLKKLGDSAVNCGLLGGSQSADPAEQQRCAAQGADNSKALDDNLNPVTIIGNQIKESIAKLVRDAFKSSVKGLADVAFTKDAKLFSPVINCDKADAQCQPWFVKQLSLMAKVGLWIVMPLLMLVVIQSIIKGSMFTLLRSAFVMLPAAILGTIAISTITQLLLDVSDDFCQAIVNVSFNDAQLDKVWDGVENLWNQPNADSLFLVLFLLAAVLGIIVVFVELILREVGVYLSTLFLPMCFAGLVWPSSAKWAKRLVEVLIGLIFSKVFIVAALSLGLSAMIGIGNGEVQPTPTTLGNFVALLFVAIVTPSKMWAFVPGGESHMQGRVASPANITGKGEVVQTVVGKYSDRMGRRAQSVGPDARRAFTNRK